MQFGGPWVRNDSVFSGGCISGLGDQFAGLGSGKSLSCSFHEAGGLRPPQLRLSAGAFPTAAPDRDMKLQSQHRQVSCQKMMRLLQDVKEYLGL